jgi:DNA repair exonuclease SbcCD nuclease subunit
MIDLTFSGKQIILGDCHFGKGKFSQALFESQMDFFEKQLFPYMKANNIDTIIQLGDFFDNRKNMDINFFNQLVDRFFNKMKSENFKMIEILGNHDIYFKNTRDVNMIKMLEMMFPSNLRVISEREYAYINEKKCYFVPWILDHETLKASELKGVEYLFGHFEIKNFQMTKGHFDEHSTLTQDFFKKSKIKRVFSGHYHLVDHKANISYVGTPFPLDWGDFDDFKFFYVIDTENETLDRIYNEESKKYVKIKYNSDCKDGCIEIHGLEPERGFYSKVDDINTSELKKHYLKAYINKKDETKYHEEVMFLLREKGCEFTVTDNQEISNLIGTDYIAEEHLEDHSSTKEIILKTIKSEAPELLELVNELLNEIVIED